MGFILIILEINITTTQDYYSLIQTDSCMKLELKMF